MSDKICKLRECVMCRSDNVKLLKHTKMQYMKITNISFFVQCFDCFFRFYFELKTEIKAKKYWNSCKNRKLYKKGMVL
jgi:hypothetical protein